MMTSASSRARAWTVLSCASSRARAWTALSSAGDYIPREGARTLGPREHRERVGRGRPRERVLRALERLEAHRERALRDLVRGEAAQVRREAGGAAQPNEPLRRVEALACISVRAGGRVGRGARWRARRCGSPSGTGGGSCGSPRRASVPRRACGRARSAGRRTARRRASARRS
jgi:hypothetical protein